MTGTADTEAVEFQQIYGLEVMVIPTNMLMIRDDQPDLVYRTQGEKFKAICSGIEHCRDKQQPVLVGTASIETSEYLSGILRQSGIDHEVLNAKHHEQEARIIAQAGRPGAVTIATNMAGRGTDIVLGGNLEMELSDLDEGREADRASIREQWQQRHEQVVKAGGLHVLGTERNESRRVDNQLRGRCGRQGDPGSSRYYLSMEDNLMRIFGSERVSGLMEKMGMEEGEAIEHSWVTRAIENSQKKVEGRNFDTRKQLLEYDDVANEQRKVIYEQRNRLMEVDDISDTIGMARTEVVNELIDVHLPPESLEEQWDIPSLEKEVEARFGLAMPVGQWLAEDDALHEETLRQRIESEVISAYEQKAAGVGEEVIRHLEKAIMLRVLDEQWKDHLAQMDHLRQGIGLRGYAQKNPKQEYKREAFGMFTEVLDRVKNETIGILSKIQIQTSAEVEELEVQRRRQGVDGREYLHPSATAEPLPTPHPEHQPNALAPQSGQAAAVTTQPFVRSGPKVGRNAPCPCGSGKKYKHCHGKL
jgi:preprotein translocase subunit SecA